MSSVPSGWPPHPAPANPAASIGWRLRHSWWLLVPIFGIGIVGGAGFLYVGLRTRRPAWWVSGIVYLVVGWIAFIVIGEFPGQSVMSTVMVGMLMAAWFASVLHACLINSSWLRWRASYIPWHARLVPATNWPYAAYSPTEQLSGTPTFGAPNTPASTSPDPAASGSAPPLYSGTASYPEAYYSPGPVATPVPPAPQPVAAQLPAASAGVIDVNTAQYDRLVMLPGIHPERAQRVLAERQARRGFGSVQEFAEVAGLAPHEFAQLRRLLVCVPVPQGRLGQEGHPQQGRVLDV